MNKINNFTGLQPAVEFFDALGLPEVIRININASGAKGYKDDQIIKSLVIMQLAGGEALDHLNHCRNMLGAGPLGLEVPSPSTARAYLNKFDNNEANKQRGQGRSFIPNENDNLAGFAKIHFHLWEQAYKLNPHTIITLDQDATFINTSNSDALFNYLGKKAYETFNTYCPEYDIIVGTQFRDGNVTPGYQQLEEFKRILDNTPAGVQKVQLRSDSAGYQINLLRYCASGANERFGVINFAIACLVTKELRDAAKLVPENAWQPIYKETKKGLKATNQEWAEVAYTSSELSKSGKNEEFRFFVMREEVILKDKERVKLHIEETQLELPLQETIENLEKENENVKKLHLTEMNGKAYKIFAIVSNVLDQEGGELIRWHRGRCGKSEEVHHILKEELAGGHIVSHQFGANAAYWNIAVLALSLHNLMKTHVLPEECQSARPKTVRFMFYSIAGLLVSHARKITLKVSGQFLYMMRRVQDRLREVLKKLCVQRV
ncbi:MAG: transposase [Dysgonamonadaceae bacterium]|nr:transposase [Dysgonamonadaceae bacterium]